jgi:hypothetical protein
MLTYLKRLFNIAILGPASEPTEHPTGGVLPVISVGTTGTGTVSPATISVPLPTPIAPLPLTIDRIRTVGPTVAIVNVSSVITDAQVTALVAALQIQVDRDFAPAWKMTANLVMIPTGAPVPPDTWLLYIMDTTDQAGALGYHDLTAEGNPLGKVFAKDDATYGLSWTVTVSHELLELIVDPYCVDTVFSQSTNTTGTLYALEIADPTEADQFGYLINGVLVSDFVYPTWFEDFRPANSTQFDHMGVINAPLQLAKGGYIGVFDVPSTTGWSQRLADIVPPRLVSRGAYARAKRRGMLTSVN